MSGFLTSEKVSLPATGPCKINRREAQYLSADGFFQGPQKSKSPIRLTVVSCRHMQYHEQEQQAFMLLGGADLAAGEGFGWKQKKELARKI
jgi:hypothetical protein